MKRIVCLILIIILTMGLVACDTNKTTKENEYEWEQLEWPTYDNAKQIPTPKSTTADVRNNGDIRFDFYVANTTLEDYKAYVEECKAKGFTIDAIEQENRYFAFNESKYELTVQYHVGDIMYVQVIEDRCEVEIKLLHTDKTSANKYDISIEIDNRWEDDGEKGKEAITFDSRLKEGKHTLTIENDDDDDINGRIDFTVTEDGEYFEFEITCSNSKIDIRQNSQSKLNSTDASSQETSTTPSASNDNENKKETSIANGCFTMHAYKFAGNFEDAFDGINGYSFEADAETDESKLFYDDDNYIRYRIIDAENNDRSVGMIDFTKPDGKTLLVSEEFTANCFNGINVLIEKSSDVSAVVVATIFAADPNIEYGEAFDVAQDVVDNISIYTGDASQLKSIECNKIRYTLYKDNKYHYLMATAFQ